MRSYATMQRYAMEGVPCAGTCDPVAVPILRWRCFTGSYVPARRFMTYTLQCYAILYYATEGVLCAGTCDPVVKLNSTFNFAFNLNF